MNAANRIAKLNLGSEACSEPFWRPDPMTQSLLLSPLSVKCSQGNLLRCCAAFRWIVKGLIGYRQATRLRFWPGLMTSSAVIDQLVRRCEEDTNKHRDLGDSDVSGSAPGRRTFGVSHLISHTTT